MRGSQNIDGQEPGVYVIDGDLQSLDHVGECLRRHGIASRLFSSAEELFRAEVDRPGCVVTEIQLSGLGGVRLVEELTRKWEGLPIVVLTSTRDISAAVSVIKAGVLHVLQKPFVERVLLDEIHRALSLGELRVDQKRGEPRSST